MGEIARVNTLNDAFSAVQRRVPFTYHQFPSLRFFYLPLDNQRARLVIARAGANLDSALYEQTLSEMGIFIIASPTKQFVVNEWHFVQFNLERKTLV